MSEHTVPEAAARLPDLIDRALAGDGVVITRHGTPVVALTPIRHPVGRSLTVEDMDWLAERRVALVRRPSDDAGKLVSDLRDEEW